MRTYPRTGSDEYRIAYRQAGILAVINIYRQAGRLHFTQAYI